MASLVTTTNQSTGYGDFIESMMRNLTEAAANEANVPYSPYEGQRVAGFSPDELRAQQIIRDSVGREDPYFQQAGDTLGRGLSTLDTANVQWGPEAATRYMNPYVQNVVDTTVNEANLQTQRQLTDARSRAALTGAFGGSRGAITESNILSNTDRNLQSTLANLYSDAYENAQTQFNTDRDFGRQAASSYGNFATAQQGLAGNINAYRSGQVSDLFTAGQSQRDLAQRNLDVSYDDWRQGQDYGRNQLNFLSGILSATPYAKDVQTTTTETGTGGSSTLGSIIAGLGLASNLSGLFNFAEGGQVKDKKKKVKKYANGGSVEGEGEFEEMLRRLEAVRGIPGKLLNPGFLGSADSHVFSDPTGAQEIMSGVGRFFGKPLVDAYSTTASGLSKIGEGLEWLQTPRSQRQGEVIPVEGTLPPTEELPVIDVGKYEVTPPIIDDEMMGYVPMTTHQVPPSTEIDTTQQGPTLGDLYKTRQEDTWQDRLLDSNPLLTVGLSMMAAGARANPYNEVAQMAGGALTGLESYNLAKRQRRMDEIDEASAKARTATEAADVARRAAGDRESAQVREAVLNEKIRHNRALEQLKRFQIESELSGGMSDKDRVAYVGTILNQIENVQDLLMNNPQDNTLVTTLEQLKNMLDEAQSGNQSGIFKVEYDEE